VLETKRFFDTTTILFSLLAKEEFVYLAGILKFEFKVVEWFAKLILHCRIPSNKCFAWS